MEKIAFITGITGQDGSYLLELLLEKSYIVYGMKRRSSSLNTFRIDHLFGHPNLRLKYGDLTDALVINNLFSEIKKENPLLQRLEVYNLGAMSHVKVSFDMPQYTTEVNSIGTLHLLDAIRSHNLSSVTRFYQASTSELYGKVKEIPQSETTEFYPRSPYAISKLYSYWIVRNYREAYQMFLCNGILFNHESPRRGETFVTRKITLGIASIIHNRQQYITLGNLEAKRDWGHAEDYVKGMWLMLQQDNPDDYVLATGETHSVREFCEIAFEFVGIQIVWKGIPGSIDEIGVDKNNHNRVFVKVDPKYFRETEVDILLGNATKAKEELEWTRNYNFENLVKCMMNHDLKKYL